MKQSFFAELTAFGCATFRGSLDTLTGVVYQELIYSSLFQFMSF